MWTIASPRIRIYLILALLVLITAVGGTVMVWYTYRMESILDRIIDRNVAAFQAAEGLETALVNQKGFVSYFFLDRDPDWLRQLGEYRQIFRDRLHEVRNLVDDENEREAVNRIEEEYGKYVTSKDQVIAYYRTDQPDKGAHLHREVRKQFFRILDLCEAYKRLHAERIAHARARSQAEAKNLRVIAGSAIFLALALASLLALVLVRQILDPLRRLALETDREGGARAPRDEVKALSRSIQDLMQEYDVTHSELERSREHLLQAEKMALVGKLAAGMAHSIRNPLTSVKMRLFSLDRTLELTSTQKEDFEVISDEIRHVDTIVQNFLEFSRPPKLKMQEISPSEVVDLVLQLMRHRLESYEVTVRISRTQKLPQIQADPELLKEVLVNLIENACEAMKGGGTIHIHEEETSSPQTGKAILIRVRDTGPGVPTALREKVFQPFFTTREEGTGLGLSIAARIAEQHGGRLELEATVGSGASFVIALPIT
jgi:signal transduction histidine kinase